MMKTHVSTRRTDGQTDIRYTSRAKKRICALILYDQNHNWSELDFIEKRVYIVITTHFLSKIVY